MNSRYALESRRSPGMNFNNLKDRKRPDIVLSFHFQRYSLQLTGTVSESGTCTCKLRINRPTFVRIMEENQTEYRNDSRGIGGKEDARWAIRQNFMLAGIPRFSHHHGII